MNLGKTAILPSFLGNSKAPLLLQGFLPFVLSLVLSVAGSLSSFRFQIICCLRGEAVLGHAPWVADSDMLVCMQKGDLGIMPVKGLGEVDWAERSWAEMQSQQMPQPVSWEALEPGWSFRFVLFWEAGRLGLCTPLHSGIGCRLPLGRESNVAEAAPFSWGQLLEWLSCEPMAANIPAAGGMGSQVLKVDQSPLLWSRSLATVYEFTNLPLHTEPYRTTLFISFLFYHTIIFEINFFFYPLLAFSIWVKAPLECS